MAYTSSNSLPLNQRSVSMSWLFTSDSGPLLWRMSYIQGLGIDGPNVSDLTSTTRPISPASIRCRAATKPASKRRMKPICSFTPGLVDRREHLVALARHSSPSASRRGCACRPAAAATTIAQWCSLGVATTTASTARVGQGLAVVGIDLLEPQLLAGRLPGRLHRLDHRHQRGVRHAAEGEVPGVDHPRPARPDHTDS